MKTSSTRAIAIEVVLIAVALLGGAGYFGVSKISRSIKEMRQEHKVQEAYVEAQKSEAAAKAALEARKDAEAKEAVAEKARAVQHEHDVEQGRNIQRSSAEGTVAALQLPESKQREHLIQRFDEIDVATLGLYGAPPATDVSVWKQKALDALAGQAAAQAELDKQKGEIQRLNGVIEEANKHVKEAEAQYKEANTKATNLQVTATSATERARVESGKAVKAMSENDSAQALWHGLAWLLAAIAGLWVLGLLLKMFALGMPPDSPVANAIHTAADTFHALLAPASVLSQTNARRETHDILERTGTYLSDLRRDAPEVATKITDVMDKALDGKHQKRIRAAYLKAEGARAASRAQENVDGVRVARVENSPATPDDLQVVMAKLLAALEKGTAANASGNASDKDKPK